MKRDVTQRFHEILDEFSTAMLVTHSPSGDLRARPMTVADRRRVARAGVDGMGAGDLWFVTPIDAPKVGEIEEDARVNVTFQDENTRFLSISGRAQVLRDREQVDRLWSDDWSAWFPEGKRSERLALIKVEAEHGEFWDYAGLDRMRFLFEEGEAQLLDEEIGSEQAKASR